ncbi:MAG: hypothetical protein SGJ02_12780 [bacterium]|nr:hypothetical protein [bacterium]
MSTEVQKYKSSILSAPQPATEGHKQDRKQVETPRISIIQSIISKPANFSLWLSAFGLVNLILFSVLKNKGFFAEHSDSATISFAVITIFLDVIITLSLATLLIRESQAALKLKEIPYQLNLSIAILAVGFYEIFAAIQNIELLPSKPLLTSFMLFGFVMSLYLAGREGFRSWLCRLSSFSITDEIKKARLVKPESNFSESHQGTLFPAEINLSVPSTSLKSGDLVKVLASEFIPCDGVIVAGKAFVMERRASPSMSNRLKEKGDEAFAGSKLVFGELEIKVGLPIHESLATTLDPEINRSFAEHIVEKKGDDKLNSLINLALLFTSVIVGQYWYFSSGDWNKVIITVAGILSLSVVYGLSRLKDQIPAMIAATSFRSGFLIKNSRVLSKLLNLKAFLFFGDPERVFDEEHISYFSVMDARVEKAELSAVLFALCAKAENPLFHQIGEYLLTKEKAKNQIIEITDFREYPNQGIIASLAGADFTIGSEEFLIDRGIYLQSAEALSHASSSRIIYVAVGEEVIARFSVEPEIAKFSDKVLKPLRHIGFRTLLLSKESQPSADILGKKHGFELAEISAGLDDKEIQNKIRLTGEVVLASSLPLSQTVLHENPSLISHFDELRQVMGDGEIVFFNKSTKPILIIANLVRALRNAALLEKVSNIILVIGLMASLVFLGINPTWPIVASTLLFLMEAINFYMIRRSFKV